MSLPSQSVRPQLCVVGLSKHKVSDQSTKSVHPLPLKLWESNARIGDRDYEGFALYSK